ncbi:MAG: 1-deoxy-D-xylulose-5-phosphate reductoisomerase [Dehalococcoidia bacterium]|nr:1-deoxy-D-xylulose-5-phosphate reductoisomerase [Dehalococcoidia bacterium]
MKNKVKNIVLLGSTGSIGQQTLDIVRIFQDELQVSGLACGNNADLLLQQVREFRPLLAFCSADLELPAGTMPATMEEMATHPDVDMVIIATTGKAGLKPAMSALQAGKTVAIANKEILVMAGDLLKQLAARHGGAILPIDSEHSAVWQCLQGEDSSVSRLLLTASGGPFKGWPAEKLRRVTASQALKHPTWKMGRKVTVDSATLFNKGLEVIEAHWLFDLPYEKIEIIIHRQSIVHSMVEFKDGSIKAQLSIPDMHLPIQYALFYPQRMPNPEIKAMDFSGMHNLVFEPVNYMDYPCLRLSLEAAKLGDTYPAVLCAADETAVNLFLNNSIAFTEIATIIDKTLHMHRPVSNPGIEDILRSDRWACDTALKEARKDI